MGPSTRYIGNIGNEWMSVGSRTFGALVKIRIVWSVIFGPNVATRNLCVCIRTACDMERNTRHNEQSVKSPVVTSAVRRVAASCASTGCRNRAPQRENSLPMFTTQASVPSTRHAKLSHCALKICLNRYVYYRASQCSRNGLDFHSRGCWLEIRSGRRLS